MDILEISKIAEIDLTEPTPELPEQRLQPEEVRRLAAEFETWPAQALLRWALERWHPSIVLVTAFQAEGMALLDMAWRIRPDIRVLTIDTGRLPQETYGFIDRIRERYGIRPEIYFPEAAQVEELVRNGGPNLFYRSVEERLRCCWVRKVEPLKRALRGLEAWVAGLRREQSASRARIAKVEIDELNGGIVKLNPLADWTADEVWSYLERHRVPHHPLYDQGYTSIGCAPCTRAPGPGEEARGGRWWWEEGNHKECGLHFRRVREEGRG